MGETMKGVNIQTCEWHARIGTCMEVFKGTCGHAGNTHVGTKMIHRNAYETNDDLQTNIKMTYGQAAI